jgi:hypothetical protein
MGGEEKKVTCKNPASGPTFSNQSLHLLRLTEPTPTCLNAASDGIQTLTG